MRFGVGLPDAKAQRILLVELRVGEVQATALVEGFQKLLIEGIALRMPEANQIQEGGCRQLEMFGRFDPLRISMWCLM